MQEQLFLERQNFSGEKVMIGLSGGINSMAVLCWLSMYPSELKPKELHLFYAHFEEHSTGTLDFVLAGVEYAKKHFNSVFYEQTNNSVLSYFEQIGMIPHPTFAPCTKLLKILPMAEYCAKNQIKIDLVGYVRDEYRRIKNMAAKTKTNVDKVKSGDIYKQFPIASFDNEWCFDIVKKCLGFYPAIYDIRDKKGKRVFKHNNCLPCKNMTEKQYKDVKKHYPEHYQKAEKTAQNIGKHWGRNENEFECFICAYD